MVPEAHWLWHDELSLRLGDVNLLVSKDEHASELFTALDDDRVWVHVKGRPNRSSDWREVIAGAHQAGRWMWTVFWHDRVVGTTSYLDLSVQDARVEIGYTTYAVEMWGSGVNAACKLLLLDWAFGPCAMNRVQLKTDVRNLRSQAAIAALGAVQEGVLRGYQRRQDSSMRDTVMYSILANEWPDLRTRLLTRVP